MNNKARTKYPYCIKCLKEVRPDLLTVCNNKECPTVITIRVYDYDEVYNSRR